MREVRDLAAGMKEAIASLKKVSEDAKSALASEMARANVNSDKVKSFINDLKEANQEVEAFLGETGSNFPPSGGSDTQPPPLRKMSTHGADRPRADINGVILNNPEGDQ